ncbi:MAG: iron (metal) dependent repressor, DtxR family [uncultured archaeon A07HB70]|jgi:Mn-dependent transcriptional regulator|nr:MAG: iron (metal) dependent repressor, DtxR family [uncultured archaeon A07HB70]
MLSDVMEDYLKIVHELQAESGPPVSTSAVADAAGKTPPTVTSALETLAEQGLVSREKYKGVELTPEGEQVALEVVRHHRLLEAYLAEALDYDWSEVHAEADTLEHHISEEFERRVAAKLDDPEVDPHGDPIPTADLEPVEDETTPLAAHGAGDRVEVARVRDRDEAELDYLAEAGVEPGVHLDVRDVTPLGVYVVTHPGGERHLPESVAETIRVWAAGDEEREPEPTDA